MALLGRHHGDHDEGVVDCESPAVLGVIHAVDRCQVLLGGGGSNAYRQQHWTSLKATVIQHGL